MAQNRIHSGHAQCARIRTNVKISPLCIEFSSSFQILLGQGNNRLLDNLTSEFDFLPTRDETSSRSRREAASNQRSANNMGGPELNPLSETSAATMESLRRRFQAESAFEINNSSIYERFCKSKGRRREPTRVILHGQDDAGTEMRLSESKTEHYLHRCHNHSRRPTRHRKQIVNSRNKKTIMLAQPSILLLTILALLATLATCYGFQTNNQLGKYGLSAEPRGRLFERAKGSRRPLDC